MEEGWKRLVGVTAAIVLAAALTVYVLRPATGPSTSNVANPPCSVRGLGDAMALGHDDARASAKATADHGKGRAHGDDPDRPAAKNESKGPHPCVDPTTKRPDKADKALKHGESSGLRHEA
jgi:hypothetical protein